MAISQFYEHLVSIGHMYVALYCRVSARRVVKLKYRAVPMGFGLSFIFERASRCMQVTKIGVGQGRKL